MLLPQCHGWSVSEKSLGCMLYIWHLFCFVAWFPLNYECLYPSCIGKQALIVWLKSTVCLFCLQETRIVACLIGGLVGWLIVWLIGGLVDWYSEQYSEILRKRWVEVFNKIFDEDNYTAISVETRDEYERIASVYPFRDATLEQVLTPCSSIRQAVMLHFCGYFQINLSLKVVNFP